MPTLPIQAILHTKNGIVFKYVDGLVDSPQPVANLQHLSPIEMEAVKWACGHPGWIVLDTYIRNRG